MAKLHFFVMAWPSHQVWAEGYQKACLVHDVRVDTIPCDRWKYRMQVGSAQLVDLVMDDDDILIVDSMFDITLFVALLRTTRETPASPKVLVYMHENQLTTPFTSQDRDKKHNTHWLYGLCNWRSLQVADGLVFNSRQHLDAFATALPKLIKEQCPNDSVAWQLERAAKLLENNCVVLHYGLHLEELTSLQGEPDDVPTILWNARLEEDKDPETFLKILSVLKEKSVPFKLVVLGTDPSRGSLWYERFRREFGEQLEYIGWCEDRVEYAKWMQKATIVLSTSRHETFGASVVESIYCGALPLLPHRLSYPEIVCPSEFPQCFYESTGEAIQKLQDLMKMEDSGTLRARLRSVVTKFQWTYMAPMYDVFFSGLASGENVFDAGEAAYVAAANPTPLHSALAGPEVVYISSATDPRVALYRPKSLRDHKEYQEQLIPFHLEGLDTPCLHGGRRAMTRMMEAIATGAKVKPLSFLTTRELANNIFAQKKRDLCPHAPVYVADKDLLDTIRGQKLNTGDAILAIVRFPLSVPLDEIIKKPPVLVLDDVRNAENVGSILRTAFCLGITSVVASKTAWGALRDSRSARCSMGTIFYHKIHKADNLAASLARMKNAGIFVYGVEIGPDAVPVTAHGDQLRWAAVLGNEDKGLTKETQRACDKTIFVPQAHGNSLNVGHAAAIAMFELGSACSARIQDGLGRV